MHHKAHKLLLSPVSESRCQAPLVNSTEISVWGPSQQPFVPAALSRGLRIPHPTPSLTLLFPWVYFNVRPFTIEIDGAQGWLFFSLHRDICGDGSVGPLSVNSCFVLT